MVLAALAGLATAPPAAAQAPPPAAAAEAGEVAACLCLGQDMERLNAEMAAAQSAYDRERDELAQLDGELAQQRAAIDVNNPAAVARFRQLLERRDALFRRSSGPQIGALSEAVARYNDRVSEYNARCASRPRDPALLAQVQARLACPPPPR
jgi:multidrug resistance efflux pump